MTQLGGPVGVRNLVQQAANAPDDQDKIIQLLSAIAPTNGGQQGVWDPIAPTPGPPRMCPPVLAAAILAFQTFWVAKGELRVPDGVIDPGGATLRKLDALAPSGGGGLLNLIDPDLISLRQVNPENLTAVHDVTQKVISPLSVGLLSQGGMLQEISQTGAMREFLFQMRKDGHTYWVGAAVPAGVTDFSQLQVFFHPTVVQNHVVRAADGDYEAFKGGWSDRVVLYTARQGGQLAGVRNTVLIVLFMTMASLSGKAPHYMFATRPAETLDAIASAVSDVVASLEPGAGPGVSVSKMAVSSFSSGIGAMRLFIRTFGNTGQIVETTDFDGMFIIAEPKIITRSPNAVGRVFSQTPPPTRQAGWVTMPATSFANIVTWREISVHNQLGWMSYYMACMSSVLV